ncbi:vanin-like protein 2 isoform X2 [Trichoplusia ni]|uniref:Vanin-like protein 2 isoform X2 n=1 Tax=Trichoplusia ni TaxID=7111 RepID=A0A7E5WLC7_TRINI|nr:vanin-like protein 2 isoform X2 [Trichoplusia ni]
MKQLCIVVALVSVFGLSFQKSTPQDTHYVAAVVEYHRLTTNVQNNTARYVSLIQEAARQNADIVVFPELTLTNAQYTFEVPINGLVKEQPVPALYPSGYDEAITAISQAALDNQIYVVINGRESLDCRLAATRAVEYCPEEKAYIFNTNVVFDRKGAIIDRYRKINLFGEVAHTPALRPELGKFTTDFGVTFGHFVCFDLMFQVPAIQVVQKEKIKNVIFPTMWFSELPYLSAVQIQEAYAYSLDVNFLGAGANNVRVGSAGSGIYSGKAGALISTMPGVSDTRLLVARVPKVPGQITEPFPGPIYDNPTTHDNLKLIIDPSLASHKSRLLVPGFQEFTLEDGDVSCTFRVNIGRRTGNEYYRYRAGAFSGVRSFSGVATGGMRACSVYACTGDERDTCGMRFSPYVANATAIFMELTIRATMPTPVVTENLQADGSVVYPVSLSVATLPLETREYSYAKVPSGDRTLHIYSLENKAAELYSFAVWGRQFSTDGQNATDPITDGASVHFLSHFMLVLVAIVLRQF